MYVWLIIKQFVVTHRDIVSEETGKSLDRSLINQHISMLYFYGNMRRSEFCVCVGKMFTNGVFLTEMSSDASISV